MRSETIKHEYKHLITDLIHQEPVRLNVTFPCPFIITGQIMVAIPCIQRSAVSKNTHDLKLFIQILVLFLRQLHIILELGCKLNLVLHTSSAALRSSILV